MEKQSPKRAMIVEAVIVLGFAVGIAVTVRSDLIVENDAADNAVWFLIVPALVALLSGVMSVRVALALPVVVIAVPYLVAPSYVYVDAFWVFGLFAAIAAFAGRVFRNVWGRVSKSRRQSSADA